MSIMASGKPILEDVVIRKYLLYRELKDKHGVTHSNALERIGVSNNRWSRFKRRAEALLEKQGWEQTNS